MNKFQVVVGNIGTVYDGGIQRLADQAFENYREISACGTGRAGGEDVTMLEHGEIKREYIGTINQTLNTCDSDA